MSTENPNETHTSRLLRSCIAAHDFARDSGIPREDAKTIMDAIVDKTTDEERAELLRKWNAAAEAEANDESDERDQT